MTTHYLEEADALCGRLAIIDYGQIIAEGTPEELKKRGSGDCITISIENSENKAPALIQLLEKTDFIHEVHYDTTHIRLYVNDGAKAISKVLNILNQQQIVLITITLSAPSLDVVF